MDISAKEFARQLMGISAKVAIDDWTWRVFGFKGRPKRGAFFNRFISESKLIKERFLLREFFILACSTGLLSLSEKCTKNFRLKIGKFIIYNLLEIDGMKKSFDFYSKQEAENYMYEGLLNYVEEGYKKLPEVFLKRAKIYTEDHFKPFWLVSIARLTNDYQSPLVVIKRVTEEKFSENLIDDVPNIS